MTHKKHLSSIQKPSIISHSQTYHRNIKIITDHDVISRYRDEVSIDTGDFPLFVYMYVTLTSARSLLIKQLDPN